MYPAVGVYDVVGQAGDAVNGVPEEFRGGEEDGGPDQYNHRKLVMEAEHRALVYTFSPRQVGLQSSKVLNGRHLAPAEGSPLLNNISTSTASPPAGSLQNPPSQAPSRVSSSHWRPSSPQPSLVVTS